MGGYKAGVGEMVDIRSDGWIYSNAGVGEMVDMRQELVRW